MIGDGATRKIFVKDGFAEFTPDTLNVLAEQAVNLDGVERSEIDGLIATAEKDWPMRTTMPSGLWRMRHWMRCARFRLGGSTIVRILRLHQEPFFVVIAGCTSSESTIGGDFR